MSAVSGSPLPLQPPLPWTRARATRNWMHAFAGIAALRLLLLAALPAFTAVTLSDLGDDLVRALGFPLLFLAIVAFSERRFLRRPPKGMLAAQLALFCAGALLHAFSLVTTPQLATAGVVVLSASTVLLGGWFLGVLLVPED